MSLLDPFELDSVEEPSEPTGSFRKSLVPWLVAISLVILFVPLSLIATTIKEDSASLEAELGTMQTAMAGEPTIDPELQQLQDTMAQVQGQYYQVEAMQAELAASHIDWPATIAIIKGYDPAHITLIGLSQTGNLITVTGRADSDSSVMDYARMLESSAYFARVVVQSITSVAGSLATLTPTPMGEAEEIQPIFLGQAQSHTFDPESDVDYVVFLAKAGRFYQVSTNKLAPGVDTVLTAFVDELAYVNDDKEPGTLSSELVFQVPEYSDLEVLIQVTNRGQYGAEMGYQLLVEEVEPTATTVPAANVPRGPSAGALATTPMPAAGSPAAAEGTPAPDMADAYESNDAAPSTIGVGETQTHNFYPEGDIDKVGFVVKGGHYYLVSTGQLAPGVDTLMGVELGGMRWENDDYAPPGTGNYASAVCFPTAADGVAVVTIANVASQFGSDKTYDVSVSEVLGLVQLDPAQLGFGPVTLGAPNPPAYTIVITGTDGSNIPWTAEADRDWIRIDPATGTTPSIMSVEADTSRLPAGSHTGSITFAWASQCRQTLTVTAQVQGPVSQDFQVAPFYARLDERSGAGSPYLSVALAGGGGKPLFSLIPGEALPQDGAVEFVILLELRTDSQ